MNDTLVICLFKLNINDMFTLLCLWVRVVNAKRINMVQLSQHRTMLFFNLGENILALMPGQKNTKHKGELL